MIFVNGLTPNIRAILDRFEVDMDGVWWCECDWYIESNLTLLGLVDECIKHVETDPKHN